MTLCTDALIADEWLRKQGQAYSSIEDAEVQPVFYGLNLQTNQYLHISRTVKEMLGYSSEEIVQSGLRWFVSRIHSEDLIRINSKIDSEMELPALPSIEYRILHKDGTYRLVCEHRCILFDKQGKPSHLIGRIELLS